MGPTERTLACSVGTRFAVKWRIATRWRLLISHQPRMFQLVVPANAGTHSHSCELIRPLWPQLADQRRRWVMDPGSALAFARLSGMTNADFRFDFQTAMTPLVCP